MTTKKRTVNAPVERRREYRQTEDTIRALSRWSMELSRITADLKATVAELAESRLEDFDE